MTASRPLGRTGLLVSPLGLGTGTFGREVAPEQAVVLVRRFLDLGFNAIDVADSYADGAAESAVGEAIDGRRDDVVLFGKVGLPLHPGPDRARGSRRHLLRAVAGSLRRLRTDHLDVLHLHRWDSQTPIEESLSTLDDIVRQGKARYVAVSNFTGWQLAWTRTVAARFGLEPPIAVQARYSLAVRDVEREILPYCRWAGIGFVAYSPLGGGLLTGKYRPDTAFPPGSRAGRGDVGRSLRSRLTPGAFRLADLLRRHADALGHTPAQLALAWLLRRPGLACAVVGAVDEAQLTQNLAAAALSPDATTLSELDRASASDRGYPYDLLATLGCEGPEYHLESR